LTLSRPALAKDTKRTVVALDDWVAQVMRHPLIIPAKRLTVRPASTARSRLPAIFCKPSLMTRRPNRKIPRPPMMVRTLLIDCYGDVRRAQQTTDGAGGQGAGGENRAHRADRGQVPERADRRPRHCA